MNDETQLHVVFGAGQIGPLLAGELARRGHRVRVVRRSSRPVEGFETRSGDATDPAFAVDAAAGASALYHCMNPSSYTAKAWAAELPAMLEALIEAAVTHDARLVVLDNLYAYGVTDGPRTEETPTRAEGRKGQVRARCAEALARAAEERGLRYVLGRAGDFFGEGADQALVSPDAVRGLANGERPLLLGDPEAPHAFSYTRDVAQGLAALGDAELREPVFHLPVHQVAPAALYAMLGRQLGVTPRPRVIRRWMLWLLWPFASLFRELLETFYQWDRPFLADDARFRARFPAVGVSLERAVAQTVEGTTTVATGGSKPTSSQSAALPSA